MGTINDKLTYLNGTKTAIKNEMIAEGITVTDNDTFRSYPSKMATKNTEIQSAINAQDTLLSAQETKIEQLEEALNNKIAQGSIPDWTEIGYESIPQVILDGFNYAKEIQENWDDTRTMLSGTFQNDLNLIVFPTVDTSEATYFQATFQGCRSLIHIEEIDTSNATLFNGIFRECSALKKAPILNTSKITSFTLSFYRCWSLEDVPFYNLENVTSMNSNFEGCSALTDESLNNILAMCISATKYNGTKTLKYTMSLSSAQCTRCQSLSNWDDFVNAGWTTGY